jgi:hypothetical protein
MPNNKKNAKIIFLFKVEFNPVIDSSTEIVIIDDNSDVEEMLILQSNKKKASVKKKVKFSQGRKQDQKDLGLQDSRNICIPVNLNKRKKTKKKMVVQGLIWNCRGLKKKGSLHS